MKNINFGIDLGTTNSGICKYVEGKVQIFKNPIGFSDTIPSVVAYKKERILIGDKARELLKSTHIDVFSSFKRKMGTDYLYEISTQETKTPIELSTLILKEVRNFVTNEIPESVVITIPASFDTIQSNATKKAGIQAGFKQVVLLQEPIAACLAYANSVQQQLNNDLNWIVYDFGGGTFDTALVKINSRELKILDHQGNNFLGGIDIDHLIIEKLFIPKIEQNLGKQNLYEQLLANTNQDYKKLYFELLYKAEEVKKELSLKETTFVEFELDNDEIYLEIEIKRHDFDTVIEPKVTETLTLIENLLIKNNKKAEDIEKIILIGGTTYIPYVRESLLKKFNIPVDFSIDPTTAVMVGAAHYAGTKQENIQISEEIKQIPDEEVNVKFIATYEVNSQDLEELVMVNSTEEFFGYYRITRKDGGFDTGLIPFKNKFSEFINLLPKQANYFNLSFYNQNNEILPNGQEIVINQGLYNVVGQPLPNDICLEVDDMEGSTYLEPIFKKNDILPLSKTIYKTTSKHLNKELDDKIIINVLEGTIASLPGSNLSIGYIEINSNEIPTSLVKGVDLELKFQISESRDLSISVYINSIDFEKKETFNPHSKKINKQKFIAELDQIIYSISEELDDVQNFDYLDDLEIQDLSQYSKIKNNLIEIKNELVKLKEDNHTDKIFHLDEKKRQLFHEYDTKVRFNKLIDSVEEYNKIKGILENRLENANAKQKDLFKKIIKDEKQFLNSNNYNLIRKKMKELDKLDDEIYLNTDEFYLDIFYNLKYRNIGEYINQQYASELINDGTEAANQEKYLELKYIVYNLYDLLKDKPKDNEDKIKGLLGLE